MNTENSTGQNSPHTSQTDSLVRRLTRSSSGRAQLTRALARFSREDLALARATKPLALRATAALRWRWTRAVATGRRLRGEDAGKTTAVLCGSSEV